MLGKKELNDLLEQENRLLKRKLELQSESYDLSSTLVEDLKETLGIQSRRSVFESGILDINKYKEAFNYSSKLDTVIHKILENKDNGNGSADKGLRQLISSHVSPNTVLPHIIAHSHVQEDGSAKSLIHDASDVAKNHLDKYERLHVATDRSGAVVIRGFDEGGNLHNVATYGLKTQSGPHKNINGTLTGISG
jgi:hypothetical protein